MTHHSTPPIGEAFRQPKQVWAIAFATMVSFMGIGLVDPILPAISEKLHATPTQAMLLFTSYLMVTAIVMFFTSTVAARFGTRKTLLTGLLFVIVFAAACSLSSGVNQIIGFRAGWGLGNALFISTALSAIVSAASGGPAGAIILYEAALGVGIAFGPLAGGILGHISWRMPFAGTATLMFIGLIAIVALYREPAPQYKIAGKVSNPAERASFLDAFRALRTPSLFVLSLAALCYNMTFFVLLAYSPFPMEHAAKVGHFHFGALQLGLVFFGWGICLAITAVGGAPILSRKIGLIPSVAAALFCSMILMIIMGEGVHSLPVMIVVVILAGLVFGILNTTLTEAVMGLPGLKHSVASSAYSGVRFLGGAISSAFAGPLANTLGVPAPYYLAAAISLIGLLTLFFGRKHLTPLFKRLHLAGESEATAIGLGNE